MATIRIQNVYFSQEYTVKMQHISGLNVAVAPRHLNISRTETEAPIGKILKANSTEPYFL